MKKFSFLLLVALAVACGKDPANDVAGTYSGNFAIADTANGQADVILTAIGNDKLRLNFTAPGVVPIMLNGVGVSEQTQGNFGLAYSTEFNTMVGAIGEDNVMSFQYTQGDTLFVTFTGTKQN
jgi:hypothetical protein